MTKSLPEKLSFYCVTILFLFSISVAAENAEPTQLTRADKSSAERSINEYLARLNVLEGQYGAYEQELSQELSGLGSLYQSVGKHADAVDVFKRQYQIERTNAGLYSIAQVDILKRMIVSLVALREWEEVEDRHHFIQQLMAYNFAANDIRKVTSLKDRAEWHLYAADNEIGDNTPLHHLLTARNALNEATRLTSAAGGPVTADTEAMYQTLLYVDYQVAIAERTAATKAQSNALISQRRQTDSYFYRNNADPYGVTSRRQYGSSVPNAGTISRGPSITANNFRNGVFHLQGLRNNFANDPTAKPGSVARIDAQIGDWCSLWQKHATARSYYQRAWQTLSAPGSDETVRNEIFGNPVSLLDFADQHQAKLAAKNGIPAGKKLGYVLYDLTVSANGKVQAVQTIEAAPNTLTNHIARTGRIISRSQFRPRYIDGVPVATENFRTKATYLYDASDEPDTGS